jgi:hypothetical protein
MVIAASATLNAAARKTGNHNNLSTQVFFHGRKPMLFLALTGLAVTVLALWTIAPQDTPSEPNHKVYKARFSKAVK